MLVVVLIPVMIDQFVRRFDHIVSIVIVISRELEKNRTLHVEVRKMLERT